MPILFCIEYLTLLNLALMTIYAAKHSKAYFMTRLVYSSMQGLVTMELMSREKELSIHNQVNFTTCKILKNLTYSQVCKISENFACCVNIQSNLECM